MSYYKPDEINNIKKQLEKAKQDLIAAQQTNDEKRIKFLQDSIANMTGTIERNS